MQVICDRGLEFVTRKVTDGVAKIKAGLNWEQHVVMDPAFLRPAEVDHLIGDASKARAQLGWQPSVDFKGLVTMMVDADLKRYGI